MSQPAGRVRKNGDADIKLRHVAVRICQACIDGVGQECHTPGCILWLHRVELPIHKELLVDADLLAAQVEVLKLDNAQLQHERSQIPSLQREIAAWKSSHDEIVETAQALRKQAVALAKRLQIPMKCIVIARRARKLSRPRPFLTRRGG